MKEIINGRKEQATERNGTERNGAATTAGSYATSTGTLKPERKTESDSESERKRISSCHLLPHITLHYIKLHYITFIRISTVVLQEKRSDRERGGG